METIADRLRRKMKEQGLSQYRLWKMSGVSQPTIKRILDGDSKEPDKSTVEKLAGALGCSYPELYEGTDYLDGEFRHISQQAKLPAPPADEVSIPQFDTGGMGGHGLVLQDQPGVIENWQVSREWAKANIPSCTSYKNLCLVTGFGDSMPDAFNPGDPVIVDTGIRSCTHDGIYFFRVGDEGFIKILQRIPGVGLMAISQNKNYRDWLIQDDMGFEVFGKVLKAWKGRNY